MCWVRMFPVVPLPQRLTTRGVDRSAVAGPPHVLLDRDVRRSLTLSRTISSPHRGSSADGWLHSVGRALTKVRVESHSRAGPAPPSPREPESSVPSLSFAHLVPGQQVVADVPFTVGQLADPLRHHRRCDHGEHGGQRRSFRRRCCRAAGSPHRRAPAVVPAPAVWSRRASASTCPESGPRRWPPSTPARSRGAPARQPARSRMFIVGSPLTSGTRKRATLTEPTKLISDSAARL